MGRCSDGLTAFLFRAPVFYRGFCDDLIGFQFNLTRYLLDQNSLLLGTLFRRPGITDNVIHEYEIVGFPTDADARAITLDAVIFYDVVLQPVAVSRHTQALIAEEYAGALILADYILAQEIIRVLVTDGDTKLTIVLQHIVLKQTMPHPPAEEQTVGSIISAMQ